MLQTLPYRHLPRISNRLEQLCMLVGQYNQPYRLREVCAPNGVERFDTVRQRQFANLHDIATKRLHPSK